MTTVMGLYGVGAGVQEWAEKATGHVQEVATFRAGGLPAVVRTIAHCGFAGTVAYSLTGNIDTRENRSMPVGMLWEAPVIKKSVHHCTYKMSTAGMNIQGAVSTPVLKCAVKL